MTADTEAIVKRIFPAVSGIRRALHAMPEPAYGERKTCQYILNFLRDLDLTPRVVAGTGVVADLDSGKKGTTIAVRADMDALPVEEKTGLPFSSEHQGFMHACGHDGHMAIVLGLAMALTDMKDQFSGRVRLIFQPAEEKPPHGGAQLLVREGVLENVDYIAGFHIIPDLPCGKVAIMKGPVMAAADEFEIKVKGSGGHASAPEKTADTILTAAKIVEGLNSIVSRMISPFDPVVISCGEIHGGNAFNVIPDEVVIRGTVRTFNRELRDFIPEKIKTFVEGAARACGTQFELEYIQCYPPLVNDENSVEYLRGVGEVVFGKKNVVAMRPLMGSEDFAEYLVRKRGCYVFFGGGKKERNFPLHSPLYDFDEAVLKKGVHFFAKAIINSALWK